MNHQELFVRGEADRWFERNREALERFRPDEDLPLRVMEMYGIQPPTVLEIGASNGYRLAEIQRRWGAKAVAVEPSAAAIAHGQRRYPKVEFHQGVVPETGVAGSFDLVILNFVFHWIDRTLLLGAVAETDRLVRDGGMLLIGDFCPASMRRVQYHHLPNEKVFTYKQRYAELFLSSGLYLQIAMLTSSHSNRRLVADTPDEDRVAVWLLRKSLADAYVESAFVQLPS